MLLPAVTGSGESVFVTERSADWPTTVVVAVALLFAGVGSVVDALTVAVLEMTVPFAVAAFTATTSVNVELPGLKLAIVQEIAPVAPTAGVVQLQPPGDDNATNVVFAGTESESVTLPALLGPPFVSVSV